VRSLHNLPSEITEDRSVYPYGNRDFFSHKENLTSHNGDGSTMPFFVHSQANFCSFFLRDKEPNVAIAKLNDVRFFNGSALGDNIMTGEVLLDDVTIDLPTVKTARIVLSKPVSKSVVRKGVAISVFVHEQHTPASASVEYNTPHIVLKGMLGDDVPDDAEITELFLEISFVFRYLGDQPGLRKATLGCFYATMLSCEYSVDPFVLFCNAKDSGYLKIDGLQIELDALKKRYQYMISDRGKFMGELDDVVSTPTLRSALNSFPSDITVNVAKDASADIQDIDVLMVVDGGEPEKAVDHELSAVSVTGEVRSAYGDNTAINVNNDVDVFEYRGGYDGIVLDDNEPLLVNDADELVSPLGSPEGEKFFSGYISKYDIGYNSDRKETASLTILSHADEYNNKIWATEPSVFLAREDDRGEGMEGSGYIVMGRIESIGLYNYSVNNAQIVYTPTSFTRLSAVDVKCARNGSAKIDEKYCPYAMVFITDSPSDPMFKTGFISKTKHILHNRPYWQQFKFDRPVDLLAGRKYYIYFCALTTDSLWTVSFYYTDLFGANGGYWAYQYDDLIAQKENAGDFIPFKAGESVQYRLISEGGDTLIPMYSKDPSYMAKALVDYGNRNGLKISRSGSSIQDSGTVITAKFNINTLREALNAIISYEPTDWYWYLDQSDFYLHVKPRPDEVTHWLTLHKDIRRIKLEHSIESLKNEVYFTGGKATIEAPTGNSNSMFIGAGFDKRWVCSPKFRPEQDVLYKIYADVEGKSSFVRVYEYRKNTNRPIATNVSEQKNGELSYILSSTSGIEVGQICIACRADGYADIAPSKVKFSLESEQNIYRHVSNEVSKNKYRTALVKKTDQRVTNALSADIIADNELARNGEPIFVGTVEVVRDDYSDRINPGDLLGFRNFGNYIDNLRLLATEVSVTGDIYTITLGAFAPKTSKRLDDLKRNLTMLENQMNPLAPTGDK